MAEVGRVKVLNSRKKKNPFTFTKTLHSNHTFVVFLNSIFNKRKSIQISMNNDKNIFA